MIWFFKLWSLQQKKKKKKNRIENGPLLPQQKTQTKNNKQINKQYKKTTL